MINLYPAEMDSGQMLAYLLETQLVASPDEARHIAYAAATWRRKEVSTWYFEIFRNNTDPLVDHLPVLLRQHEMFAPYKILAGDEQVREIKRRCERLMWAYVNE